MQGDKGFFPKVGEENPYNEVSLSRGGCGWRRDDWRRAGEEMGFFRVGYNKCRVCALYI